MSADNRILDAIKQAVNEAGQPDELANRLIMWFQDVASGNEQIGDPQPTARRLEAVFDATETSDLSEEVELE